MKKKLSDEQKLIPEGERVVCITKIDDSDYEKFQKLTLTVEDETGGRARVNFNFVNDDNSPNEVAEGIYARMCRAALNDQTLDECDTSELIGCFLSVEIQHNEGKNGGIFANVKKWLGAGTPFQRTKTETQGKEKSKTKAKQAVSTSNAVAEKKESATDILARIRAKKAAGQ